MTRRAVVAGTFDEGSRDRLGTQVMHLLTPEATPEEAIGVVVPHAGYVYSGRVAGAVYARIAWPESWVILGPNHTGQGLPASIMTSGEWETPLGTVQIDGELGRRFWTIPPSWAKTRFPTSGNIPSRCSFLSFRAWGSRSASCRSRSTDMNTLSAKRWGRP